MKLLDVRLRGPHLKYLLFLFVFLLGSLGLTKSAYANFMLDGDGQRLPGSIKIEIDDHNSNALTILSVGDQAMVFWRPVGPVGNVKPVWIGRILVRKSMNTES